MSSHLFFSNPNSHLFVQFKLDKLGPVAMNNLPVPTLYRDLSHVVIRLDSGYYPPHLPIVSFRCVIDDDDNVIYLEVIPRYSPFRQGGRF